MYCPKCLEHNCMVKSLLLILVKNDSRRFWAFWLTFRPPNLMKLDEHIALAFWNLAVWLVDQSDTFSLVLTKITIFYLYRKFWAFWAASEHQNLMKLLGCIAPSVWNIAVWSNFCCSYLSKSNFGHFGCLLMLQLWPNLVHVLSKVPVSWLHGWLSDLTLLAIHTKIDFGTCFWFLTQLLN